MEFIQQLEKFIQENNLFSKKDKLLIAVSGGIDSVVLAHCLAHLGYSIGIAHCNFQLRGEESEKDEFFVRNFACQLGVSFFFEKFPTLQIQQENSGSIQMVARELRYTWFEKMRYQNKFDYIITAHHQNDLLETVLLNIVRGTGLAGLHGIIPKSGCISRPLLFARKDQIEKFAEEIQLEWREDLSNQSNKYKRNLIRNKVIPILKDLNPALETTVTITAEQVSLSERFILNQLESLFPEICKEEDGYIKINIRIIKEKKDGLFILQSVLKKFNFSYVDSKSIFKSADSISGKMFFSVSHRLIKDRDYWIV
ncbi:MAG: tRNA lysidine(34) synthetase TilS, partial [Opitutaceae bacterium]|nr:tRNA lysidine(34) synthetase TilS [Cytophagales bacterium]